MDRVAGELAPSAARRAGYVWEAVGAETDGARASVPAGAATGPWAPGPAVTPFPEPTSPGSGSSPVTGASSEATGSRTEGTGPNAEPTGARMRPSFSDPVPGLATRSTRSLAALVTGLAAGWRDGMARRAGDAADLGRPGSGGTPGEGVTSLAVAFKIDLQ